ncbi:hypothetical protein [Nitratireductor sp. GCM10026969]|uniref:hypothetical protein n=1 Tax=Nitratireductor sp. GCM10026969 TaxID=3252645 RepID=UPI00361AB2B1
MGAMSNKVQFLPYDPNNAKIAFAQYEYGSQGGSDMDKLKKDIDAAKAKGHSAVAVWYNPKKKHPFLQSMNTGDIYIRGHGMPGFKSIEGGRGGERVDYDVVADRLIESGLKKTFSGKIKCYNCHSAESGDPATDPECLGPPFARLVADELFSRGYKHCTFYGYLGRIDSFVKDGSRGKHHYTRDVQGGKLVELGRASEARIQFHPKIKMRKPNFFQRLF